VAIGWLALPISNSFGEEASTNIATDDAIAGDGQLADLDKTKQQQFLKEACDQIVAAIVEARSLCEQRGDKERAQVWQKISVEYVRDTKTDDAVKVAKASLVAVIKLRNLNELRLAERTMPQLFKILDLQHEPPGLLYIRALILAAQLEADFERYDSAHKRMLLAAAGATTAPESKRNDPVYLHLVLELAELERKRGKTDTAEELCVKLLEAMHKEPDCHVKKLCQGRARIGLAGVYADKGRFREALDVLPDQTDLVDKNGAIYPHYDFALGALYYRCCLGENTDLKTVAEEWEDNVDETKRYFGESSRQYVEAIELLAQLYTAQSKYNEAVELLKKSADVRAGLLGPAHPSIKVVWNQIDAVRNQSLTDSNSVDR
jgi:tetratricopeptide (TPR) repeat protein